MCTNKPRFRDYNSVHTELQLPTKLMNGTRLLNGTVSQKALTWTAKVRARRGPLALRSAPGQELSLILRTTSRGHSTHSRCPKPRQCDSTFAGVGCQKAVRVAGFDHFRIDACGCRPTTSWAYAQVSAALLQAHPSFSRCGAGKPPPWCHSTHSRLVLCEITRLVLCEQARRG